jgi:hypothetical protein
VFFARSLRSSGTTEPIRRLHFSRRVGAFMTNASIPSEAAVSPEENGAALAAPFFS